MKPVIRRWAWRAALLMLAIYGVAKAFEPSPYNPDRTPKMNDIPPKIAALFEKTRPVCFGRFMIDVPEKAKVLWGPLRIPYSMYIYPNAGNGVRAQIRDTVDEITKEKHNTEPSMLIGVFDSVNPESKIVVGYKNTFSDHYVRLYSYIQLGKTAFVQKIPESPLIIKDKSLRDGYREDKNAYKNDVEELLSVARRLRLRAEDEIPTDPGLCIESGFLSADMKYDTEHVSVGFSFPEYPDVSFSISTYSTDSPNADETMEATLAREQKAYSRAGFSELYALIRRLRQGKRVIALWKGGESLGRVPGEDGGPSVHEFLFKMQGVASDMLRPCVTINLDTGVKDNTTGAMKPSLEDDEAVALWDKLTSSIRVRPTGEAAKPADATRPPAKPVGEQSRLPLGTRVASWQPCPQTGLWECDPPQVEGARRRLFQSGQRLPPVMVPDARSLWQRLRGQPAKCAIDTVWTLVEDAPDV
ncbi:MAG: hypothetical protein LBU45_00060 [Azoarcus sp.]|nr:hypothetical protein [Azoarcus sp.]